MAIFSLSFINGVNGKSQAELGTIHILRKHLQGEKGAGGWSENGNFCLFLVLKTCLHKGERGVPKA